MDHPITLDPRVEGSGMPDVASNDGSQLRGRLDRVGMNHIEVPVLVAQADGSTMTVPARADAYVNLEDPDAKGIHMSRLFIALQESLASQPLSPALFKECLERFVESHADLSKQSELTVHYEHMLQRKALISDNKAWRSYPCSLRAIYDEGAIKYLLKVRIVYSSTCPCSAALARQLIQEAFRKQFGDNDQISTEQMDAWLATEEAICATPHSQRSFADIELVFDDCESFPIEVLVDGAESVLQTAVQAAVKREDEQEFARLNGQNLMFCEDAARRLRHWLEAQSDVADYRIKVSHVESLHPHDAVSIVVKGIAGGLNPE